MIAVALLATQSLLVEGARGQQSQPPPSTPAASSAPATAKTPSPAAKTQHTPATAAKTPASVTLTTQKDKDSYAFGMNLGKGLSKQPVDLDPKLIARGLIDSYTGGKTLLTDDEAQAALKQLQADAQQKMEAKMQQEGEENKKAGDAFLAANKTKDGVVTLPSGLQYKVITQGTGPKPTAADTVVCQYRGTLIDGTEFDSSYKRGQPATFQVGRVIKGWTEALQLMPVGSKWQLYIPANLAYGERSPAPQIPPNSTMIFDVELVSIQGQPKPATPATPATPANPENK